MAATRRLAGVGLSAGMIGTVLALAVVVGVVVPGAAGQGADPLAGEWEMTQRVGNRETTTTIVITGEPGRYAGGVLTRRGRAALRNVTLEGDVVRFERPMRRGNEQTTAVFTGELEGETITGSFDSSRDAVVTLRRTRGSGPGPVNPDAPFRLNTVGYRPGVAKAASIPLAFESFKVVDARSGAVVLSGEPSGPVLNEDTNEPLYTADFSAVREAGEYKLVIEGLGESAVFRVAEGVYAEPLRAAVRAMYLWRCGTAVRGEHGGDVFEHAACHLEDAWGDYVGLGHTRVDATGGWHDAGDYNKYVTNAGVTVGVMLAAWEHFGERLGSMDLGIPESGGGLPDYLDEVKWELDWLLKMQGADGGVYHKVSTLNFGGFILPEKEAEPRYLVSVSSTATADFAAMTAMGSRAMRRYDGAYADRLLAAAVRAYGYLAANPRRVDADQSKFSTGGYASSDEDDRLWAAAELFEATGEKRYLEDVEARIARRNPTVEDTFDWGNVGNLGVFTYVMSGREGRDAGLAARVKGDVIASADRIVEATRKHGYGRTMGTQYYWGANGSVARKAVNLHVADVLEPRAEYRAAIAEAANHLLGRNVFGRSLVTGVGHNPPMNPHSRRSGGDEVRNPWPGYLVGGGHPRAVDWFDVEASYETNEIAINWNGALIYLFAAAGGE